MKKIYFKINKCLGCKSCEIACALAHSKSSELLKAIREKVLSLPREKIYFYKGKNYPLSCRHCKDPKCVEACMASALVYDKEKGMVLHDELRCVGCWMCVMVCPYGAIRPNLKVKLPLRCDMCDGLDMPRCVKSCLTKAIIWAEEEESAKK